MFKIDTKKTTSLIQEALKDVDGGELFLESISKETLSFEDNIVKDVNFSNLEGFGLRAFCGDQTVYTHSAEISEERIKEAANFIKNNKLANKSLNFKIPENNLKHSLYKSEDVLQSLELTKKIEFLKEIYNYTINKNQNIKKVKVSFAAEMQKVQIMNAEGNVFEDIRPLCRLNIIVIICKDGKFEQGYAGIGGRFCYNELLKNWKAAADKAIHQAEVNLKAIPAPAGELTVVLASGWPGIILHEAIGHGLEADFNRKKTSAFSNLIGKSVAAEGVTVVDDGTIAKRRGSINIDDEGTPSSYNVLIENGKLVNYMYDLMNAKIMQKKPTGNGRRESYQYSPMPRMTNTYMLPGNYEEEEIIASTKSGIYLVSFSGGQVDITSGEFVFSSSEGYLIENGKITKSIKGATLIGNGPKILHKVSMVGNSMQLDTGIGTCGKDGQNVPVGVGQPTIKIEGITVGGTA